MLAHPAPHTELSSVTTYAVTHAASFSTEEKIDLFKKGRSLKKLIFQKDRDI